MDLKQIELRSLVSQMKQGSARAKELYEAWIKTPEYKKADKINKKNSVY